MSRHYTNPILCGFYPDPSICRVGQDYYLVCSSFAYYPGLPLFHSRDLVHWELITHVLNRPSQIRLEGLGVSKGVFAPTIRHHANRFYLTGTIVDGGGNFVVTAEDAAGPWSDPVWLPINGIDPSPFFDEAGSWIIYNSVPPGDRPLYNGHRTIRMRAFDTARLCLIGDEHILVNGGTDLALRPRWVEGPHLYRRGDWYYLLTAQGGTGYDHAVVIFRSRQVDGPYLPHAGNPLLCGDKAGGRPWPVTSAGHADLVQTPGGDWHAVFLATRPYEGDHYNTGRETFLVPVDWKADWPEFNRGACGIEYRYPLPLPPDRDSQAPYSGNFSWTEAFDSDRLHPDWIFLRAFRSEAIDLRQRRGWLTLRLLPETLDGRGAPAFLCRRQQHLRASASTRLAFHPQDGGEKAGLVVFQDSFHFYFLALGLGPGGPEVQLFRSELIPREEGRLRRIASLPVAEEEVDLRIDAHADHYAFRFRVGGGAWQPIGGSLDARLLSTCTAGGFTGCVLGLYATSSGRPSDNQAQFGFFHYEGRDTVWD